MKKLNDAQIAAKSVEISKCLISTAPGSFVNFDLGNTQTIGDAARLAVSIRHRQQEMPREVIAAICSALKIDFRLVESKVLPIYEKLGWSKIKWKGDRVGSVLETLPPTEDILGSLGSIWREQDPTAVEEASLVSLEELSKRPFAKDTLTSELNIQEKEFEAMLDYGEQARYLGKFVSEEYGKETIWTPLYWASNAEKVTQFLKKQSEPRLDKIRHLTEGFKTHPGMPDDKIASQEKDLLNSGIYHGFFPTIEIRDRQQKSHEYIFAAAPQFDIDKNTDIFEKARMIVGCIRHGQYHAEVTKILYPRSILRGMRTDTMKPHPYADIQYAVLILHGIVRLEQDRTKYGKAYRVVWIDTPENNLAADIADLLLQGQEIVGTTREELEARKILVQGVFNYSSEQRRLKATARIVAKKEYDRMMELLSGVKV